MTKRLSAARAAVLIAALIVAVCLLMGVPRSDLSPNSAPPAEQPLLLRTSNLHSLHSQLSYEYPTPITIEVDGSALVYYVIRTEVLLPDAEVKGVSSAGVYDARSEVIHLKGYRRGGTTKDVLALSFAEHGGHTWFQGVIRESGRLFELDTGAEGQGSVVASVVEPEEGSPELDGIGTQCRHEPFPPEVSGQNESSEAEESPYSPRSVSMRRVQIATVAAQDFTTSRGSAAQANAELQALFNAVNIIYENDLMYQLTIVSQLAWEGTDPFSGNQTQPLIDQLRATLNPETGAATPYDVAQLFTTRALYNGQAAVLGYAWGPVCNLAGLSVVRWAGSSNVRRTSVAHEIGHNLGAYHDSGGQFIMSAINGGQEQFSDLSRNVIHAFADAAHCVEHITDSGAPPGVPGIVAISRSLSPADTSIRLTIRAPTGGGPVGYYELFRSSQPQSCAGAPIATNIIGERFHDQNTQGNATYYYSLRAWNANGVSTCSEVLESLAPPTPYSPGPVWGVVEELEPSPFDRLTFLWGAFSNANHYDVYRSTAPVGCAGPPHAAGVTSTSFLDTNITYGTRYFYSFRAVNSAGESDCAGPFSLALPEAVTAQVALVEGGQVRISWPSTPLARSYPVHVSTDGEVSWTQVGWLPSGGSVFHTPIPGSNPVYRVLTCNASGCNFSPSVAPSFSWSASAWSLTNPSYYEIRAAAFSLPQFTHQVLLERSPDGENFQTILSLTPEQAVAGAIDPNPLEGVQSYYRLMVCSVAHCMPSNIRSIAIPPAVSLSASSNRTDGVEISFSASSQPPAARFLVYWSRTNNGSDWLLVGEAQRGAFNQVSYLHSNADPNGTPQYYLVRSCSLSGCALSNVATGVVRVPPIITSHPQGVNAQLGGSASFSVTAEPSAFLTYSWRRNGFIISGATTSSYSVPSVELSHLGNYDVSVTNTLTGLSILSNPAPLGLIPAPPGNLDAEFLESLSGIRVSWVSVLGATQYTVFRALGDSSPCPSGAQTWNTTGLIHQDTSAVPGVTYRYSVRANPSQGQSTCSLTSVPGMRSVALITGATRINGAPLPGVGITIPGLTTVLSDSSGVYRIHLGGTGTVTLVPSLSGYTFNPPSQSVTVSAGTNSVSAFNAAAASSASSSVSSSASSGSSSSGGSSASSSPSSSSSASSSSSVSSGPTPPPATPSVTPTSSPTPTAAPGTPNPNPTVAPTATPTIVPTSSGGGSSSSMSGSSHSSSSSSSASSQSSSQSAGQSSSQSSSQSSGQSSSNGSVSSSLSSSASTSSSGGSSVSSGPGSSSSAAFSSPASTSAASSSTSQGPSSESSASSSGSGLLPSPNPSSDGSNLQNPACTNVATTAIKDTIAKQVSDLGRVSLKHVKSIRRGVASGSSLYGSLNRAVAAVKAQSLRSRRHASEQLSRIPSALANCGNSGTSCLGAPVTEVALAIRMHEARARRSFVKSVNSAINLRFGKYSTEARSQRRAFRRVSTQRLLALEQAVGDLAPMEGLCS